MDKEQQTRDEESRQGLLQDQECEEFELNDNSQDSTSSSSSRYDHESKKNQPDDKGPRYHLSSSRLALLVIGKSTSYFPGLLSISLSLLHRQLTIRLLILHSTAILMSNFVSNSKYRVYAMDH